MRGIIKICLLNREASDPFSLTPQMAYNSFMLPRQETGGIAFRQPVPRDNTYVPLKLSYLLMVLNPIRPTSTFF